MFVHQVQVWQSQDAITHVVGVLTKCVWIGVTFAVVLMFALAQLEVYVYLVYNNEHISWIVCCKISIEIKI